MCDLVCRGRDDIDMCTMLEQYLGGTIANSVLSEWIVGPVFESAHPEEPPTTRIFLPTSLSLLPGIACAEMTTGGKSLITGTPSCYLTLVCEENAPKKLSRLFLLITGESSRHFSGMHDSSSLALEISAPSVFRAGNGKT